VRLAALCWARCGHSRDAWSEGCAIPNMYSAITRQSLKMMKSLNYTATVTLHDGLQRMVDIRFASELFALVPRLW
jgi:hypothetical protein